MLNNFAATVQNFAKNFGNWQELLIIVQFLVLKTAISSHCNTSLILPVNTLRCNYVTVNKN